MRWCLAIVLALSACSSQEEPAQPRYKLGAGPRVAVTGVAHVFGPSGGTLEGARVSVAEAPEISATIAGDGSFSLSVPSGGDATFVIRHPGYRESQTATLFVGSSGLDQVGFQVPTDGIFDFFARLARIEPDPERCQIVSTVSRLGTAPYGGDALGEPGVVVSIDPPLTAEHGPVYFNWVKKDVILPDPTLRETTIDGGVIFSNVPEGEYRVTATKAGKRFSEVRARCRKGMLVNAAPPRGLQEL